jgi:hypothetical protein
MNILRRAGPGRLREGVEYSPFSDPFRFSFTFCYSRLLFADFAVYYLELHVLSVQVVWLRCLIAIVILYPLNFMAV